MIWIVVELKLKEKILNNNFLFFCNYLFFMIKINQQQDSLGTDF